MTIETGFIPRKFGRQVPETNFSIGSIFRILCGILHIRRA